ncbi:hypothetical protein IMZ48_48070 [Candidatus Bathyarchaeota archaeon]|nr:hypothetical protein [Candidatus Bathyarchaeota archaeon]
MGEPETGASGTNTNAKDAPLPTIHTQHHVERPYQSVKDFLSNTDKFQIIESTLREGEQFANAFFDTGASLPFTPPHIYPSTDRANR